MFTKFGNTSYEKVNYKHGDFLLFGSESKGYTDEVFKNMKNRIKIGIIGLGYVGTPLALSFGKYLNPSQE